MNSAAIPSSFSKPLMLLIFVCLLVPVAAALGFQWFNQGENAKSLEQDFGQRSQRVLENIGISQDSKDFRERFRFIDQAMENFGTQNYNFYASQQMVFLNNVFQQMAVVKLLAGEATEHMQSIESRIDSALAEVEAGSEYEQQLLGVKQELVKLGRDIFKINWQFEGLSTSSLFAVELVKANGFEYGQSYFEAAVLPKIQSMAATRVEMDASLQTVLGSVDKAFAYSQEQLKAGLAQTASPDYSLAGFISDKSMEMTSLAAIVLACLFIMARGIGSQRFAPVSNIEPASTAAFGDMESVLSENTALSQRNSQLEKLCQELEMQLLSLADDYNHKADHDHDDSISQQLLPGFDPAGQQAQARVIN